MYIIKKTKGGKLPKPLQTAFYSYDSARNSLRIYLRTTKKWKEFVDLFKESYSKTPNPVIGVCGYTIVRSDG